MAYCHDSMDVGGLTLTAIRSLEALRVDPDGVEHEEPVAAQLLCAELQGQPVLLDGREHDLEEVGSGADRTLSNEGQQTNAEQKEMGTGFRVIFPATTTTPKVQPCNWKLSSLPVVCLLERWTHLSVGHEMGGRVLQRPPTVAHRGEHQGP